METAGGSSAWDCVSRRLAVRGARGGSDAIYGPFVPDERTLGLLGDLGGKRVLELGCGPVPASLGFARQGALCTAIDFSPTNAESAKSLAEEANPPVEIVLAEIASFLREAAPESFDLVFSAHALQYAEEILPLFMEARRAVCPGGAFVFSVDHPLRDISVQEGGITRLRQSYFDRGAIYWNWRLEEEERDVRFVTYHRTIADYVNALLDTGWVIERLFEPEAVMENETCSDTAEFELLAAIPVALIVKARKPR